MEVIESAAGLAGALDARRASGATVGLVPTMGALHAGHLSLVAAARRDCDLVALSVFVNPLQFGPGEDLATYPRDPDGDRRKAQDAGVDVLFVPSRAAMYPREPLTSVRVAVLGDVLEGRSRPGHLDGVATVVAKLLNLAGRCRAYFGEKDYQQLLVVRRLVSDLAMAAEIVACPVVREADGLALSSRNARLGPAERAAAPVLHRALAAGREAVLAGAQERNGVEAAMREVLGTEPLAHPDYAEVVGAADLGRPGSPLRGDLRLLLAARIGPVRLVDNLGVSVP
ncbi:MAG: pantoate--beta-alanine ligase [Acidimicrobiales bacterium]